LALLG